MFYYLNYCFKWFKAYNVNRLLEKMVITLFLTNSSIKFLKAIVIATSLAMYKFVLFFKLRVTK
jgi:hypothetical protein